MHRRNRLLGATLGILLLLACSPVFGQEAFRVVAVPWVGTAPFIPHDGVAGQWHWLQAVAQGTCAQTIQYRWDPQGDGTFDYDWRNASNRWDLGLQHTYPDSGQTRLYAARVEARCGADGEVVAATFSIRVHSGATFGQRVNRAISNGQWYGHRSLTRTEATRRAHWSTEASTAALAQGMMNRGHRAGVDPTVDPYVEDVQWMLHDVLTYLQRRAGTGLQQGEEPDVNGDGYFLRFNSEENYGQGPSLEAISSWGDMDYVIPNDIGAIAEVAGHRLGEVAQNASEYFFWAQSEVSFNGGFAGGWDYSANAASTIDTSQVGWAAVALEAAELNAGVIVPEWVKERVLHGAEYMHSARVGGTAGAYGYRTPSATYGNIARSGAMMSALAFALDRNPDGHALVGQTRTFLGDYFTSATGGLPTDGWRLRRGCAPSCPSSIASAPTSTGTPPRASGS